MTLKQILNTPSFINRIILASLFFCAVSSCTKKDIHPADMLLLTPGEGEIFYTGTRCRITLSAPNSKHVTLELYQGSDLIHSIADNVENSSVLDWIIPADIPENYGYSIHLTDPEDNTRKMYSIGIEIRKPGEVSSLTDDRDSQAYRTVKIGTQWWMAENFNLVCEGSYCYRDNESECELFGRLYTMDAALKNAPEGWHLPGDDEWKQLEEYLGIDPDEIDAFGSRGRFSGNLLEVGGGTGFDAQLGGYQNHCVGNKFGHRIYEAHLWTCDQTKEGKQIVRVIVNSSGKISRVATICHNASSVRYIKDQE